MMKVLKLFILIVLLNSILVIADIQWGECPASQQLPGVTFLKECANISFPLNRADPSQGNVTSFVRRSYNSSLPTGDSVWLIQGGPGDTTRGFEYLADILVSSNPLLTVYMVDQRGAGLSSPLVVSHPPAGSFNPYNASLLKEYDSANLEIIARYANTLQYYSTWDGAMDFKGVIDAVAPSTVSIYALSYGTYFTNTYLQLPGARADCVFLDGPAPQNRWVLENTGFWASQVAEDILSSCTHQSQLCSQYLGAMGHLPKLVLDSIVDGTLPCLSQIAWLNSSSGQHWTSTFSFTLSASDPFHPFLGPFWFRLYRCSPSDVEQLNHFYQVRMAVEFAAQSPLDYSYGLAVTIGTSEVYSLAGPRALTYDQQVQESSRLLSEGSGQFVTSYARDVSNVPLYVPNPATFFKFAHPSVPVLILVGTMDPNTEQGLGPWLQNGLGGNATLLTVPYSAHGTVNPSNLCVDSILLEFISSLGQSYDPSCLSSIPQPDWEGTEEATEQLSMSLFGTPDLWNGKQ